MSRSLRSSIVFLPSLGAAINTVPWPDNTYAFVSVPES
jgi:hypothetical protein